VSVTEARVARRWLASRIGRVTTYGSFQAARPASTFNLAFGHDGLLALGVPPIRLAHLEAFRQGMAARADALGDVGPSAPARWELGAGDSHALLVLTAAERESLADAASELRDSLPEGGLTLSHEQHAYSAPEGREHFGFQDGFSQPAVPGASAPRIGEGTLTLWRRWRRLALGEFVLGHRDEGGRVPAAPLGPLGDDATFMVVRKLAQDVGAFRSYVAEAAERLHREPAWVAAKMLGRWQNGSSLARYPQAPGPPASQDPNASRFRYGEDPHGYACPLGAHVRRANPRDSLGYQGRLTQRHRIIRRGMSYGAPLPAGISVDDGVARGLMFVAYQGAIERQFEFIQGQWLGDGNPLRLGDDRDPILAAEGSNGQMIIQGRPPVFLAGIPRFVTTCGGGYYLLPGIAGLRALADGAC